ncbi:hypothetical protein [Pseudomonas syringae]|uniref:hypothetical protein n=1 Tax=Pseudomonas syringae TaxID=317 RepID=UPI00046B6F55|nr:hypothetical protein [Pseudomonas syringae]AYL83198.1 hypothetical protein CN228_27890 [Pseudomonas syringae pv. actinidiae str. Shaanxi_M228]
MSLIVQVFQNVAAVSALVFGYVKLSAAPKIGAHSLLRRTAVLSAMKGFVAMSVWQVAAFAFRGRPANQEGNTLAAVESLEYDHLHDFGDRPVRVPVKAT